MSLSVPALRALVETYDERLAALRAIPLREQDGGGKYDHLRWKLSRLRKAIAEGQFERAHRLHGFIQGALWGLGVYTPKEITEHNKGED